MSMNRSLTTAHCIRSDQAICQASSTASTSNGWARSVSAHLADVDTVTPGPLTRSFLSVTQSADTGEVTGGSVAGAREAHYRCLWVSFDDSAADVVGLGVGLSGNCD